jgi:nitrite reductase (NO-forming)
MKGKRLLLTGVFIGIALIFASFSSMNKGFIGQGAKSDPARGEQIYKTKCIVCHQADGKGLPGAFPPLAGSDYLLADKVRAVAQVLNGSNLEITVNKMKYTAPMPPQVDNKEDAVAVINYVLNNFGNKGGTVTLEEVKDVVINPKK